MGKVATKRSFRQSSFALALGASYGVFCAGQAGALPGTPTVQGTGVATFTPGTNSLTVNQTSENLAIVWTPSGAGSTPTKAFDILSGETVTFMQPNTGAVAYNSISCSGCSATIIAGTLQSRLTSNPTLVGGSVWLFDPNGIVIGQGAVVNVGGFIASSLQGDIPTWLANPNNPLTINDGGGATPANGAVTNDGNITASNGVLGYVALIGNSVAATQTGATGTINVGFGSINLAAGRVATITALNGGGLNFALSTAAGDAINVNNGSATSAVAVTGPAALTGAAVTLSANVAAALFTNAVNTSGVIRAVNLDNSGGTIKLVGAGSPVVASGTLNASGSTGTDPVGTVQITGDSVSLGATTVGGALTVEATTGGIAQTGAVAAGAATFTTDTTNQTIVLSAANTFSGAVSLNTTGATGNAAIVADALNLGTSTVGGTLTATATAPAPGGGGITESGALTAAAGSSFTSATNIDLSTQANNLNNPAFVFTGATGNLGYRDINSILLPATNLHGGNI
ncbi:MAG: filamentous hemagglutinin N-terminal domain-containing protein, partial [Steroidobacteraceae bacterium]